MDHLSETLVENVPLSLAVLDTSFNVLQSIKRFKDVFPMTRKRESRDHLRDLRGGERLEAAVILALSASDSGVEAGTGLHTVSQPGRRFLLKACGIRLSPADEGILITLDEVTDLGLQQLNETEANATLSLSKTVAQTVHEINNPLAAIMGFTQLALQRDAKPLLQEYLNTVYSQAKKASWIMANLQSIARDSTSAENPTDVTGASADV